MRALSIASAGAALAASAWHIARNAAPPAWDDAWYLELSFRLWTALRQGPLEFAAAYVDAFKVKAPLISLVPLPLYALFGPGERTAVWANLPLAALGAWAWGRAAQEWWGGQAHRREIGALAGALATLLPFSYGLSRIFLTETLVAALLGLWAWRCAAARRDDGREAWRLGLVLGLGLLAKSTFPLLAAGFAWPARARLRPHARRGLLVAAAVAATWYAANLPYVAGFAWSAGFGAIAGDYTGGASGVEARMLWANSLLRNGLSWPLALAAAAVLALARPRDLTPALWGLAPLLVYAAGVNREPRLAAPLLPVVAAIAARAAFAFRDPRARAAAAGLLLGAGLWVCARQTFSARGESALAWNGAPESDPGWDRSALLESAARAAGADGVAAIALEHRLLNANNMSSLAAERGLGLRFVSLGYAQRSPAAALIRLKDKDAAALVLVEGAVESPDFLNRANAGVAQAARSGRLPARPAGRVALAPGVTAEVWALAN